MAGIWKHCNLCGHAVRYEPDVFETEESMSKELDTRMDEHQEHLCQTCSFHFATCSGEPKFGNCVGNDNVIYCEEYFPK